MDKIQSKSIKLKKILKYLLRHILRGESLVKEVIEGWMKGMRGRVKARIMLLDDIKPNDTYEMIKRRGLD